MRSFEKEVVKAVLNGTDLGDLNHSKRFPDKFREFVAAEVRKRTVGFLGTRLPQTGFLPAVNIQADKGTTVHNTRQFTTVTTIYHPWFCLFVISCLPGAANSWESYWSKGS